MNECTRYLSLIYLFSYCNVFCVHTPVLINMYVIPQSLIVITDHLALASVTLAETTTGNGQLSLTSSSWTSRGPTFIWPWSDLAHTQVIVRVYLIPPGGYCTSWGVKLTPAWATSDVSSSDVCMTVARQCVGETSLAAESVVQASHRYPQYETPLTGTSVVRW